MYRDGNKRFRDDNDRNGRSSFEHRDSFDIFDSFDDVSNEDDDDDRVKRNQTDDDDDSQRIFRSSYKTPKHDNPRKFYDTNDDDRAESRRRYNETIDQNIRYDARVKNPNQKTKPNTNVLRKMDLSDMTVEDVDDFSDSEIKDIASFYHDTAVPIMREKIARTARKIEIKKSHVDTVDRYEKPKTFSNRNIVLEEGIYFLLIARHPNYCECHRHVMTVSSEPVRNFSYFSKMLNEKKALIQLSRQGDDEKTSRSQKIPSSRYLTYGWSLMCRMQDQKDTKEAKKSLAWFVSSHIYESFARFMMRYHIVCDEITAKLTGKSDIISIINQKNRFTVESAIAAMQSTLCTAIGSLDVYSYQPTLTVPAMGCTKITIDPRDRDDYDGEKRQVKIFFYYRINTEIKRTMSLLSTTTKNVDDVDESDFGRFASFEPIVERSAIVVVDSNFFVPKDRKVKTRTGRTSMNEPTGKKKEGTNVQRRLREDCFVRTERRDDKKKYK